MESKISLSFLFVVLMGFLCSSQAYKFYVGGKDGWVLNPSENYIHWAERNRFLVNDTLLFKYNKGFDSVLIVNKDDYFKCNKEKPKETLNDGISEFKFHRSGPFFFISGYANNCENGQKLIIVVMAVRNITHNTPPAPKTSIDPSPSPPLGTPPPPSESPVAKAPTSPPQPEFPRSGAPEPSVNPPGFEALAPAPAPTPTQTGTAPCFGGSADLVLGFSVVLGTFFGLF